MAAAVVKLALQLTERAVPLALHSEYLYQGAPILMEVLAAQEMRLELQIRVLPAFRVN